MKKTLIAIVSCMFLFCGCSFDKYEIGTDIIVTYPTVESRQWVKEDTGVGYQYVCTLRNKYITNDVMDNGAVIAYFIDETGSDHPLPYSFTVLDADTHTLVPQNITFEANTGTITFVVEWENGVAYDISENYDFKVCVMKPGDR
jgi:hypothetical protein